jgi:hypothetical protein
VLSSSVQASRILVSGRELRAMFEKGECTA